MNNNHLSIFETMAIFGISRSSIREWKRIYDEKGADALLKKNMQVNEMNNKKDSNIKNTRKEKDKDNKSDNENEKDNDSIIKDLKVKNRYLQMRADYYERLCELAQEDEKFKKKR